MREREIFDAALAIADPAQRSAYLAEVCAGKQGMRQHIERLLDMDGQVGSFLEAPAPSLAAIVAVPPLPEGPGTVIGPYKLMEQIGEGGMGLVYVAEQQHPVRRQVALKVIKPGMDSRQVIARFEAERQALALMDHPNIAKILDAGTTEPTSDFRLQNADCKSEISNLQSAIGIGRPYFVMELVRGVPITEFCDRERLTTRQRLGLFLDVCAAVQHAHQKGVIHRDLKPSNIMVTLHDVKPVVKVIDFGIAKATGQQLTDKTLYTGFAQMVGTPQYMSPEQAGLSGLGVDTRSDIYSLGVLLYELLTGATPFAGAALKQAGLDEVLRQIREDEPPRPSHRVSTLAAAACTTVSQQRGVVGRRLQQLLQGELDWVVMRALEKDRDRRYESASALAADVQHYLNDEPVEACPPSAGYRLRKFARRNRRALVMAGVLATVLVAATAVSIWQAVIAREAQRQAEIDRDKAGAAQAQAKVAELRVTTEAAIARAVNEFLQKDLLGQAASAPKPGQEITGDPYLTVREALDRAAARIGLRFQDQPLVEAAIRTTIGAAYNSLSEHQRAVPHLERALALRKAHLGPDHPDTLGSMHHLATACEWVGRFPDAIALRHQILEILKTQLGPDHAETLACMCNLAGAYRSAGQWDTSVRLLEQLLEKQRTICGPTHPSTLGTMHQLAMNYGDVDRLAESLALHAKVLEYLKSTMGPEHQSTWPWLTFAQVCQRAGKLDQADQLLREALQQNRKRGDSLGRRQGTANTLGWMGLNLLLQERYAEAEPHAREALATFEKQRPDDARRFYWMSLLGAVLLGRQKYAEAEPFLLQGYEGMKQREAITHAGERCRLTEAGERLVHFYNVTNQQEKARKWREKLAAEKAKQ